MLQETLFPPPPEADLSDIPDYEYPEPLQMPAITEKEVCQAVRQAAPNKAPGPDGIPNLTLHHALAIPVFLDHLTNLFNTCLQLGYCPEHFRKSTASKQAQLLVGALEAAQTQQQEMHQMVRKQVQAHLAEELSNWRAEQQIHEEIYLERITNLEQEVSKLRTELMEAQHTIQRIGPVKQDTPTTNAHLSQMNQHDNNMISKTTEMTSQKSKQKPTFADLAALLSTRPGGQEWQEVTKKKQKNQQIQAGAVAGKPDPTKLKSAKDSPKEARRLLFRREGGKDAPRSEREDIILAIN